MARLLASVNADPVAGIALDLGVSSTQLDTPERGFSFRLDGPLDMRMSGAGESAADLVATLSESDLAELIRALGEERLPGGSPAPSPRHDSTGRYSALPTSRISFAR